MSVVAAATLVQVLGIASPTVPFDQTGCVADAEVVIGRPLTFSQMMLSLASITSEIQALRPLLFTAKQRFQGIPTERNRNALIDAQRRMKVATAAHQALGLRVFAQRQLLEV